MNQTPVTPKSVVPGKPPLKKENSFFNYWGIWVVLAVLLVFIALGITGKESHVGEDAEAVAVLTPPVFGEPEYVGSLRCKDCHWREYDAWKSTLHSRFMQPAVEHAVLGDFKRGNELTVNAEDSAGSAVTTRFFIKEGKYYANTIGAGGEYRDFEISYVIGIGRTQNYITVFPDGGMHILPAEWSLTDEKWRAYGRPAGHSEASGDGQFWSDPGNTWQVNCGGCHVTGIEINYDKAAGAFNTEWADLGIGCEACHGAGSNHVKAASVYFDYEKDTIVNPARLPWRLRAMVCGQCHNWGLSTAKVEPSGKGFPAQYGFPFGFKPGTPLYKYFTEKPGEERKHHQQYNEWETSQHAKAGIMCTNCHNVHPKDENVKTGMTKMTSDSLCMDCHKTLQRRSVHRIHTFGSCVACHMPATKGHEHNHTFDFISPAVSVKAGGVDKQPNACNSCHHHKDTPPENLVEFLDSVKMADMPRPYTVHGR